MWVVGDCGRGGIVGGEGLRTSGLQSHLVYLATCGAHVCIGGCRHCTPSTRLQWRSRMPCPQVFKGGKLVTETYRVRCRGCCCCICVICLNLISNPCSLILILVLVLSQHVSPFYSCRFPCFSSWRPLCARLDVQRRLHPSQGPCHQHRPAHPPCADRTLWQTSARGPHARVSVHTCL